MPHSPYTDLDRPPLSAAALRRALVTPAALWTDLEVRTETASTNADVAAAARLGAAEGLVVVAERQTAGRGRQGRTWSSPARAGLTLSVLLRPAVALADREWAAVPARRYGWLPLLAGVAIVEAVARLAEVDAVLKWPNDLLVRPASPADPAKASLPAGQGGPSLPAGQGGREAPAGQADYGKCAGILAESVPGGDPAGAPSVVLGIGLNVTLRDDELPPDRAGLAATSLQLAGAVATDRDPLLRALLRAIADWYARWRAAGGDPDRSGLREAYLRHCATIGRPIRVLLPAGEELAGTATTVDDEGRLAVILADGSRRVVPAGDIVHVR